MTFQDTILTSGNMDQIFGDLSKVFPEVGSNDGIPNYGSPILNMINRSSSSADSTSPESNSDVFQSNKTRLASLSYDRTALYERTQSFERQEHVRIPPYERAQNNRTLLQNYARTSFDEQPQFNMSPPSESTLTPYCGTPIRGQYERTPLPRISQFERMEVDRASKFRNTPPYESISQVEKSLPYGVVLQQDKLSPYIKTSQAGSTPPYERVFQVEKTPPFQRTSQFEITVPNERVSQLEKTPPHKRNLQLERSPAYESTSQFGRTLQLRRTPPYESISQFDRTMPYERALQFDMTPLQRNSSNESTSQFERTSQFGRTPPYESTSQFDRTMPYERAVQFEKTPSQRSSSNESTLQFDVTMPYERPLQFNKTPLQRNSSNESTSQFRQTSPNERTSQLRRTPPYERTLQFGRTPPYESTSQFGRTPSNENISKFFRTPPCERVSQLERLPSVERTSQYDRTPPYERDSQYEFSTIFDYSFDARLDAEAKDFIPLAMRHHRPIVGRKFLDYQSKCEFKDETENIAQNTEQKSYELFPSGNSCFEFSTPVRDTLTSSLPNLSLESSPEVYTPQVHQSTLCNPTTSTAIVSKMCSFCKKNGERPNVYSTHCVKEKIGKKYIVTCPILRSYVCETCGATQDDAHTITYCPILRVNNNGRPLQSTTITLKNTRIKSSGKRRY